MKVKLSGSWLPNLYRTFFWLALASSSHVSMADETRTGTYRCTSLRSVGGPQTINVTFDEARSYVMIDAPAWTISGIATSKFVDKRSGDTTYTLAGGYLINSLTFDLSGKLTLYGKRYECSKSR